MVCIVTYADDLHALAIQRALHRGSCACHILLSDRIAQRSTLGLRLGNHSVSGYFLSSEDAVVEMSQVGALWLRRPNASQVLPNTVEDPATRSLVDNDCTGGLRGFLTSSFHGKWISDFDSLLRASDKIAQLRAAAAAGFRVPETLVTQHKSDVLRLHEEYRRGTGIVVKTVVGGDSGFLLTRRLKNPAALDEAAFLAAPAIYQECIAGSRHIRLQCFGDRSLAASIDSCDLDWRPNLNVPILPWPVPENVHRKVRRTFDLLGLAMGVVDLKETPEGELVWLEVNPQGQFLFLEPLTGIPLAQSFANYLESEARQALHA